MKQKFASSRWTRVLTAILLATLALLGVLVTMALADHELPIAGSAAFIQTSGPNTALGVGDWYTNAGQGDRAHNFQIFVPCTVASDQVFTLDLFDPELGPVATAIDEVRGITDTATFELLAPDGTLIVSTDYPPSAPTHELWDTLATFTRGDYGCGAYTLLASTSDNDDNAWRLRLGPDDPDGVPGSGDEPYVGSFETSFQHQPVPEFISCQDFYFFVPVTASIRLNNFDMDNPGYTPLSTIVYYPPGDVITGTPSGATVWNNGGTRATRAGDVIIDPTPGWWRAELCINDDNQYIFEPEGLSYFFQQPLTPTMTVSKDDGLTVVSPGQRITYIITYRNDGAGAALNATLTDILPLQTSYVDCAPQPCGEVPPPGSGVVTYSLGTVPGGAQGQVSLTVDVDAQAPTPSVLTNTVTLDYQDTLGNQYPPEVDDDVDVIPDTLADLSIIKSDEPDPVAAGDTLRYTLVIANAGPDVAENVVVADTLPAGVTLVSATPSQGGCTDTTCALGPINAGGQATVTIVVTVNAGTAGPLLNSATVSSDTPDPDPSNNTDEESTRLTSDQPEPPKEPPTDDTPPPTPTPLPTPVPPPTPAVLFLPETGVGQPPVGRLWQFMAVPVLVGLLAVWAIRRH